MTAPRLAGRAVVLTALVTLCCVASAVTIRADRTSVDSATGQRVHHGDVRVREKNFHLRADKLIEHRTAGQLVRIQAFGTPATFKQDPVKKKGLAHGQAQEIEFIAASREIKLKAYVVTDTAGNTLKGKQFTYRLQ